MNKNLQDLAWSVLPKEFKEEVRTIYAATLRMVDKREDAEQIYVNKLSIMEDVFGFHNLTSDSEGEEMLTVSRKEVMEHFREAKLDRIYYSNDSKDYAQATGRKIMLVRLFGKDKCLPDDKADEKADEKVPYETPSDIDSSEPNPAEPKFKIGDKVKHTAHPHDDGIYRVDDIKKSSDGFIYHIQGLIGISNVKESDLELYYTEQKYHKGEKVCYNGYVYEIEGLVGKNRYALKGLNFDLDEDMIEPYTEPDTSHETPVCENHSDKTSQKEVKMNSNRNLSQNIADCDKQLDNILKDSFRNERRLNIATRIMSAILSNQRMLNNLAHGETTAEGVIRCVVDATMMYTDALIAECEKGII